MLEPCNAKVLRTVLRGLGASNRAWLLGEFTLERFKYRFDLCQLHVARPQHAGISGGKVGAQQVLPVAPFRLLEFFLIHTKLEGLPRDLLAFSGVN